MTEDRVTEIEEMFFLFLYLHLHLIIITSSINKLLSIGITSGGGGDDEGPIIHQLVLLTPQTKQ